MYFIPYKKDATQEDIIKIDKEIELLRKTKYRSIKSW